MSGPDIAKIAAGLTKAQRAFVLAASYRWPKKWWTIKRHAKLDVRDRMRPIQNMDGLLRHELKSPYRWTLTETGLAVRAHLMESTDAAE